MSSKVIEEAAVIALEQAREARKKTFSGVTPITKQDKYDLVLFERGWWSAIVALPLVNALQLCATHLKNKQVAFVVNEKNEIIS